MEVEFNKATSEVIVSKCNALSPAGDIECGPYNTPYEKNF